MDTSALFTSALGISSPWCIESIDFNASDKRMDIRLSFARGSRFDVDGVACPVHDTIEKTWRHLNFFEHECYLKARVPRVRTPDGRTLLVMPPWAGKPGGFTLLFESLTRELCRHMPVSQAARLTGVSDDKLWRMLDVYVNAAQYDENHKNIETVGIDETSVAKGHSYVTLFVDMARKRTIYATAGKGAETVKSFADMLPDYASDPENITRVSCDMSPAFIKGVREYLPNAEITFDKFHIIKIINEGVDAVRREEAKTQPLLKKSRFAVLKNDANLTEKQHKKKEELSVADLNLKTMEAVRMRENFQALYRAETEADFSGHLHAWISWVETCGLKPMEKAAHTVARHIDGILSWKQSQLNNGILEGLNSVIQAAKRKARGYKTKHFITMTLFLTGKLDFYKINPTCQPT